MDACVPRVGAFSAKGRLASAVSLYRISRIECHRNHDSSFLFEKHLIIAVSLTVR
jgi:hypothetical protein